MHKGTTNRRDRNQIELECWFLWRGENRSTRRETFRNKDENQQQTQPTYDTESGNRTRTTLVGGKCSHHCTIPASLTLILLRAEEVEVLQVVPCCRRHSFVFSFIQCDLGSRSTSGRLLYLLWQSLRVFPISIQSNGYLFCLSVLLEPISTLQIFFPKSPTLKRANQVTPGWLTVLEGP